MSENASWHRDEATGMFVFDAHVIVNAPVDVCFSAWSNFSAFPKLLRHIDTVQQLGEDHWHWEATIGGTHAQWDARTSEFRENAVISWEAYSGVKNSGSVYFSPEGRGCRVAVELKYDPPYGIIGDIVAQRRFNDQFAQELQEDLHNFKVATESGRTDNFRRAA